MVNRFIITVKLYNIFVTSSDCLHTLPGDLHVIWQISEAFVTRLLSYVFKTLVANNDPLVTCRHEEGVLRSLEMHPTQWSFLCDQSFRMCLHSWCLAEWNFSFWLLTRVLRRHLFAIDASMTGFLVYWARLGGRGSIWPFFQHCLPS